MEQIINMKDEMRQVEENGGDKRNAVGKKKKKSADISDVAKSLYSELSKKPFLFIYKIGVFIGAIIAYIYFGSIGYVPDFELKDAATLLVGISLSGVVLTVFLAVYFVIPGLLLHEFVWKKYFLISESVIEVESNVGIGEKKLTETQKRISNFFIFSGLLSGVFCIFSLFCLVFYLGYEGWQVFYPIGSFVISLPLVVLGQVWLFENYWDVLLSVKKAQAAFLIFIVWAFSTLLLFIIFSSSIIELDGKNDVMGIVVIVSFWVCVVLFNTSFATLNPGQGVQKNPYKSFALGGSYLLFAFLMLPGSNISIVKGAFRVLGIGNVQNATFLVSKESCDALNKFGAVLCQEVDGGYGCLHPRLLLTRMGSEYLLDFSLDDGAKNTPSGATGGIKIPLKKTDVIAWSIRKKTVAQQTSGAPPDKSKPMNSCIE